MKKFNTLHKAKIVLCAGATAFLFSSCYKDFLGKGNPLEVSTINTELTGGRIDAVTFDQKGNIYASQFGNFSGANGDGSVVFKIDKFENTSEFITDLSGPLGNAIDDQGNFYVIHNNNGSKGDVLKITPDGTRTLLATIDGFPSGLTLDIKNNLYVSNFVNPTIHKITPDGVLSLYAENDLLAGVVGIDFNRSGKLIAGNFNTANVLSINTQGEVTLIANIPNIVSTGAGIGYLTVAHNSIFATAINAHQIFTITMDGEVNLFAGNGEKGSDDGNLLEATFNRPNGIAFDSKNNTLYISEFSSSFIRTIKF